MKRTFLGIFAALTALLALNAAHRGPVDANSAPFDILIRDGRILDGTGSPW
jgi:hypothetical protein